MNNITKSAALLSLQSLGFSFKLNKNLLLFGQLTRKTFFSDSCEIYFTSESVLALFAPAVGEHQNGLL